jgi:PAS domain S-box-containing protein
MPTSKRVRQMIATFTLLISVGVALAFPVFYAVLSYNYTLGNLEAQAEISAQALSSLINENPGLWRFETLRIEELLARQPVPGQQDTRRVFDSAGERIAERLSDQRWPRLTLSRELYCAGVSTGHIEITRSLRPLAERLGLATLVGLLAGIWVFRTLPFRAVLLAWKKLQEANDFLQNVMDGSSNAFVVLDAGGRIQMVNRRCTELTGYPEATLLGKGFASLFRGEALRQVEDRLGQALGTGPVAAFETELTASGDRPIIVTLGATLLAAQGEASRVVVSLEDITERKQAEEVRHRVDKLESVGLLAGGIAHDFNNLLTGILGNLSMLKMTLETEDRRFLWAANAEKASLRAAGLTRQLLTFAKGGEPVKKRIDPGPLIQESTAFASMGANVRCECSIPPGLWPCDLDAGQIHQVINNLVLNAIQAMPAGGNLKVTAENLQVPGPAAPPLPPGSYVKVAVRDQGPGIPPELLPKIFNPYFTTKRTGNGLGLATCFSILQRHGGTILVDSEPGTGSTFTFFLPASGAGVRDEAALERPIVAGTGRILVMDDEEIIREATQWMLQSLGYTCATARDGAEAVALYRQAASAGEPFAAVIMDLTVPGGMGGQEALARLREQDPGVRAIVSSGYSESAVMADHIGAGFADVLKKPYDIEDMSRSLARILRASA